jgi:hypothetical protein|tara:strand:- start:77 stop:595 length:519 start_codon:yes stop_codon:yes gene_type:complete
MAIIYSYPTGIPNGTDHLIGTQIDPITEENRTLQFSISQIATLTTQGYLESTTTVTNAQLTALQATDVQLIAKPGPNKYIKVLEVSAFLDYTAPVFTFASPVLFSINSIQASRLPNTFLQSNADAVFSGVQFEYVIAADTALLLTTAGVVGGSGGSSLQVKIRYQILDITAF